MTWPTMFDARLDDYYPLDLPGQQMQAAHANTSLEHRMNLDFRAPAGCQRLTGIMAAIGHATYNVEIMEKMMEAGMNMACLNMSFGTKEEHIEAAKMLRQAAVNFSATMGKTYPLAIGIRMAGRKIRTGQIAESYGDAVELITGDTVRLTTDETYKDRCSTYTVYVDFPQFAEQLKKGDTVLLDNESIALKVEVISLTTLTCKIERGGFLGSDKDVFVPHVIFAMADYTDKIKHDLDIAIQCKVLRIKTEWRTFLIKSRVDFVMPSFVSSAQNIKDLKDLMGPQGRHMAVVANIQTVEGYRNFDEIVQVANAIMITRQELGSDISPNKLVVVQKNMIARANKLNIPICISAHVLSSMRYHKSPTRGEVLDIANCILDGVDCLSLSAETSVGLYPVETVACLASTCVEAEACLWSKQVFSDFMSKTIPPCDQLTGTAFTAVLAAQRCIASAIVVITSSGKSAQIVAKYRPRCPIVAITRSTVVARNLHFWRGVMPLLYLEPATADWLQDIENRIKFALLWGIERGFIKMADPVVTISGWKQGSGFTNTMRVIYVPRDIQSKS